MQTEYINLSRFDPKTGDYYNSILKGAWKCVHWLSHTKIRDEDSMSESHGAYFNYYDAKKKLYPMIYLEITGYAVQFWVRLYEETKNVACIAKAKESAEFIVKSIRLKADKKSIPAFPYGFKMPGRYRIERYFTFDNAICIAALSDMYVKTGVEAYAETAIAVGKWLLTFQKCDGSFESLCEMENENANELPRIESWFGDSSILGAKNAIAILKLYKITRDENFLESAEKLIGWAMAQQNADGSFRATTRHGFIFTHASCYVLEALLYCSHVLHREDIFYHAKAGGEWLARVQNGDGSLFKYYGNGLHHYFQDIPTRQKIVKFLGRPREAGVTAQAARIWLLLNQMSNEERFYISAKKAIDYLLVQQAVSFDREDTHGGIPSYCIKAFGRYWQSNIYSTWEAMFACHAFMMYLERLKKSGKDCVSYIF